MSDTFQRSIDALGDSLRQSIEKTKRPPKRVVVSLEFLQDLILAAGPTVVQADFTISMMGVPIEARSFPLGRYFIVWDADGQRRRIPVDIDKV